MLNTTTTTTSLPTITAGDLAKKLRNGLLDVSLVVRFHREGSTDFEIHRRPWDGTHSLEVFPTDGHVHGYKNYAPKRGVWGTFSAERFFDVVDLLPKSAELCFVVELGGKTNQYMETAVRGAPTNRHGLDVPPFEGLHGDAFYLEARFERRGKTVRKRFLLDTSTCPQNSARFGHMWH